MAWDRGRDEARARSACLGRGSQKERKVLDATWQRCRLISCAMGWRMLERRSVNSSRGQPYCVHAGDGEGSSG